MAIIGGQGLIGAFTSFRALMIRMLPVMGAFYAPLLAIAGVGIAIAVGMKAAGMGFEDFKKMGIDAVVALSNKWNDMLAAFQTIKDYMGGKVGFGDWTESFERNRSGLSNITAETLVDPSGSLGGAIGDYLSEKMSEGMDTLKGALPGMAGGFMDFFGAADDFIMPGVMNGNVPGGATSLGATGTPDGDPLGVKLGSMTADQLSKYDTLMSKISPLIGLTKQYTDAVELLQAQFSADGPSGVENFVMNMNLLDETIGRNLVSMQALFALGDEDSFMFNFGARMVENFSDAANAAETFGTIAADAFSGALDHLTEFTLTGKMDIRSFALDTIAQLQKVIMKMLFIKMLEGVSGGGGFGSGIAGSLLGAITGGRATGGPVQSGKAYMVGERGPELFVPPSGGSIKNATATAGMAQAAAPQITIVNSDDPASIPAAMNTDAGAEVILNVLQRNPEALRPL